MPTGCLEEVRTSCGRDARRTGFELLPRAGGSARSVHGRGVPQAPHEEVGAQEPEEPASTIEDNCRIRLPGSHAQPVRARMLCHHLNPLFDFRDLSESSNNE